LGRLVGAAELRHQLVDTVAEIDLIEAVAGGWSLAADLKRDDAVRLHCRGKIGILVRLAEEVDVVRGAIRWRQFAVRLAEHGLE
jgi:redox-regulated HSP33 family molecular chaperone